MSSRAWRRGLLLSPSAPLPTSSPFCLLPFGAACAHHPARSGGKDGAGWAANLCSWRIQWRQLCVTPGQSNGGGQGGGCAACAAVPFFCTPCAPCPSRPSTHLLACMCAHAGCSDLLFRALWPRSCPSTRGCWWWAGGAPSPPSCLCTWRSAILKRQSLSRGRWRCASEDCALSRCSDFWGGRCLLLPAVARGDRNCLHSPCRRLSGAPLV